KLKLAQTGDGGLAFLQCEGSAGPLDLFADVLSGGGAGFWHTHLLAQLSLTAKAAKGKVALSARDAGDPVAGVTISVGGRHLETNTRGQVTLGLRAGSYTAT